MFRTTAGAGGGLAHILLRCSWLLAAALVLPATVARAQEAWVSTVARAQGIVGAEIDRPLAVDESVHIAVVLRLRNEVQLRELNRELTRPGSPGYRRWLAREKVLDDFAPTQQQAEAVAGHLRRAGFRDVQVRPSRLLVEATGDATAIAKAFDTEVARVHRGARRGIANLRDVRVPPELGASVLTVLGLQTLDLVRPMSQRADRYRTLVGGSVQGLNPMRFQRAYDADGLVPALTTRVAVITQGDMAPTISDLHLFQSQNGLPYMTPTVVTVGAPSSDTSNFVEWNLDTQTMLAMSGGQVQEMILYAANSLTTADITLAYDRAVQDNLAAVINVSLGLCERSARLDGSMAAGDQIFQLAVAQGQTVAASSGDSGARECGNPVGTQTGAAYPASSPYVIAVGGTTLSTDAGANRTGETAWSGSGGSPSLYEPRPTWQSAVVAGTRRGVADVAFAGDPNSGAIIFVNGGLQQWGGTSLSAPIFAGAWARIQSANQARLGFPATWIYARGVQNPVAYNDVTAGNNGDYAASAGWDHPTGWGSFDVSATALFTRSAVAVASSPAQSTNGQSVTLTATVTGNSPTGTVQFYVNGVAFGAPVSLSGGVATLTTNSLPSNADDLVTATYSGDFNNAGASTPTAYVHRVGTPVMDVPLLPAWAVLLLGAPMLGAAMRARRRAR